MKTVTVEWVMSHGPCGVYPESIVRELIGEGVSRVDAMRLDLPPKDLVWVATRPRFLSPDERRAWLDLVVERAIRRMLGRSGSPAWEAWAAAWLSGEDRTASAAAVACAAARAAEARAATRADAARAATRADAARAAAARAAAAAAWAATRADAARAADAAWAAAWAAWAATRADAARAADAAWAAAWAADAAWAVADAEREAQVADLLAIIAR